MTPEELKEADEAAEIFLAAMDVPSADAGTAMRTYGAVLARSWQSLRQSGETPDPEGSLPVDLEWLDGWPHVLRIPQASLREMDGRLQTMSLQWKPSSWDTGIVLVRLCQREWMQGLTRAQFTKLAEAIEAPKREG